MILLNGGLPDAPLSASVGRHRVYAQADETESDFRDRAIEFAIEISAGFVLIGGLGEDPESVEE